MDAVGGEALLALVNGPDGEKEEEYGTGGTPEIEEIGDSITEGVDASPLVIEHQRKRRDGVVIDSANVAVATDKTYQIIECDVADVGVGLNGAGVVEEEGAVERGVKDEEQKGEEGDPGEQGARKVAFFHVFAD